MKTPIPLSALLEDIVEETPFYIAAAGIGSRPRCSLKHGDTFFVVDSHVDIGTAEDGPDGLFTTTRGFFPS
jgi:hypothetical protein